MQHCGKYVCGEWLCLSLYDFTFKCSRVKLVKEYIATLYGTHSRPLVDCLLDSAGCVSVIDLICLNSETLLITNLWYWGWGTRFTEVYMSWERTWILGMSGVFIENCISLQPTPFTLGPCRKVPIATDECGAGYRASLFGSEVPNVNYICTAC